MNLCCQHDNSSESKFKRISKYIIKHNPIPLARPRFTVNRHVWDSQKLLKITIAGLLEEQHANTPLFEGALHADIIFYMPLPKCSKKTAERLEGSHNCGKTDLDNLCKFIFDVANGLLYKDDSQVASICCKKLYGNEPRTELILAEIK